MPATMESLGIDRFTLEDRMSLLLELRESVETEMEAMPLTQAQCEELDRRIADDDAHPEDAIPWEVVKAELDARWQS